MSAPADAHALSRSVSKDTDSINAGNFDVLPKPPHSRMGEANTDTQGKSGKNPGKTEENNLVSIDTRLSGDGKSSRRQAAREKATFKDNEKISNPSGPFGPDSKNTGKTKEKPARTRETISKKTGVSPFPPIGGNGKSAGNTHGCQLHRRHLSESQRAMVGAKAMEYYKAEAKERQREAGKIHGRGKEKVMAGWPQPISGEGGLARDHAGKAVGVGGRTIDRANRVLKHAARKSPSVGRGGVRRVRWGSLLTLGSRGLAAILGILISSQDTLCGLDDGPDSKARHAHVFACRRLAHQEALFIRKNATNWAVASF